MAPQASHSFREVFQGTAQGDHRYFIAKAQSSLYQARLDPYNAVLHPGFVKAVKGIFMGGGAPTTSFVPAPPGRPPQTSSNGAYATVG